MQGRWAVNGQLQKPELYAPAGFYLIPIMEYELYPPGVGLLVEFRESAGHREIPPAIKRQE